MVQAGRGTQDARRKALKSILRRRRPKTQQDLVEALESRGFSITQSSLSRDLASLGARKVDGAYRLPGDDEGIDEPGQAYPTLFELRPFVRWRRERAATQVEEENRKPAKQYRSVTFVSLVFEAIAVGFAAYFAYFLATTRPPIVTDTISSVFASIASLGA